MPVRTFSQKSHSPTHYKLERDRLIKYFYILEIIMISHTEENVLKKIFQNYILCLRLVPPSGVSLHLNLL